MPLPRVSATSLGNTHHPGPSFAVGIVVRINSPLEGAREWRRIGLDKPSEIAAANDDSKAENDQLGRIMSLAADICVAPRAPALFVDCGQ